MPSYSTNEIQTLLEAAAYKAGVELNTFGFQRLSEAIIREGDPYGVRMTPRYLKESIWQRVQLAFERGDDSIGLSQERVDTLAIYLDFPHFNSFKTHYHECREMVSPKVVKKRAGVANDLQIVSHHQDTQMFGDQLKKSLEYSGLKYNWLYPDEKIASEQIEESIYSVWLLSDSWSSKQILQILENDHFLPNKAKNILLFKLCELSPEVERTIPFDSNKLKLIRDPQLGIVLSVFKSVLKPFEQDFAASTTNKNSIKSEIKKIKKFRGVFLDGKAQIKAKYVAGGDMYIKIKK